VTDLHGFDAVSSIATLDYTPQYIARKDLLSLESYSIYVERRPRPATPERCYQTPRNPAQRPSDPSAPSSYAVTALETVTTAEFLDVFMKSTQPRPTLLDPESCATHSTHFIGQRRGCRNKCLLLGGAGSFELISFVP
jgi:hypothetical protein